MKEIYMKKQYYSTSDCTHVSEMRVYLTHLFRAFRAGPQVPLLQ